MVGFQRLINQMAWIFACLLAVMITPVSAAENFGPNDAKNLVVMVESRAGDLQEAGAGIVLGRGPAGSDSVYVATAFHVAFPDGEEPDEVKVKFWFLPGETKRAIVLDIRDMDLDFAVLKVEGVAPASLNDVVFDRVRSSVDLDEGNDLYSIGNPGGVAWDVSPEPDGLYQRISGGVILFKSQAIQVGYSGGGLFTSDWYLVGMIRTDGAVESRALSMDTLFAELSYRNLKPDLAMVAMARPKIISFSSRPSTITVGEKTTLSWQVSDAHTVLLNDEAVSDSTETVSPPAGNITYTLSVKDEQGKEWEKKSVTVQVKQKSAGGAIIAKPILTTPVLKPIVAKIILTNGTYTIQQKSNGRYVDAHEHNKNKVDFGLVTRDRQNNNTQRWILRSVGKDTFTIQQKSNNRYVDAHDTKKEDYKLVTRDRQNNDTQRWIIKSVGANLYTIQQKSNKRYVDAHESSKEDFRLVTRTSQKSNTQRWIFTKL